MILSPATTVCVRLKDEQAVARSILTLNENCSIRFRLRRVGEIVPAFAFASEVPEGIRQCPS